MPRLAANLTMMFPEIDFLDRFAAARTAGFQAVEFLFPYAYDKSAIAARLADSGLELVLFNGPPGDWDKGERGFGALPGRSDEFRRSIELACEYAHALKSPRIHVMAGIPPVGAERAACVAQFAENLRWAAAQAATIGADVMIEPLNHVDMPGYFLTSADHAVSIIDAVNAPNLKLQFDLYHQQMSRGAVIEHLTRHFARIGHIQIAGVPGRNEPDTAQELNTGFVFRRIDELGYQGWIGCEYRPRGKTLDGLGWLAPYLGKA
jgi:hydroxypyruvate isomerase